MFTSNRNANLEEEINEFLIVLHKNGDILDSIQFSTQESDTTSFFAMVIYTKTSKQ
jgi:hypothetical protein